MIWNWLIVSLTYLGIHTKSTHLEDYKKTNEKDQDQSKKIKNVSNTPKDTKSFQASCL
jgi:hypothetical protein